MTDTALIVSGVVHQVWRDMDADEVARTHDGLSGDLVEFSDPKLVCGMLWDGRGLTPPPPPPVDLPAERALALRQIGLIIDGADVTAEQGMRLLAKAESARLALMGDKDAEAHLAAEAELRGLSVKDLATAILAKREAAKARWAQLETIRVSAKQSVEKAQSKESIAEIIQAVTEAVSKL